MALTDYCGEEFAKFRGFYLKKVPKLDIIRWKLVNFSSEKGCLGCLLRS